MAPSHSKRICPMRISMYQRSSVGYEHLSMLCFCLSPLPSHTRSLQQTCAEILFVSALLFVFASIFCSYMTCVSMLCLLSLRIDERYGLDCTCHERTVLRVWHESKQQQQSSRERARHTTHTGSDVCGAQYHVCQCGCTCAQVPTRTKLD
jgi:hypothetical protein